MAALLERAAAVFRGPQGASRQGEDEFAGPASAAILPRIVLGAPADRWAYAHLEVGYDGDFDTPELRRFLWAAGVSVPTRRATIDVGVAGSEYERGLTWTPDLASFSTTTGVQGTMRPLGDNRLGTTFVDVVVGGKLRLGDQLFLTGAASIPVVNEGVRPAAVGTLGFELVLPTAGGL